MGGPGERPFPRRRTHGRGAWAPRLAAGLCSGKAPVSDSPAAPAPQPDALFFPQEKASIGLSGSSAAPASSFIFFQKSLNIQISDDSGSSSRCFIFIQEIPNIQLPNSPGSPAQYFYFSQKSPSTQLPASPPRSGAIPACKAPNRAALSGGRPPISHARPQRSAVTLGPTPAPQDAGRGSQLRRTLAMAPSSAGHWPRLPPARWVARTSLPASRRPGELRRALFICSASACTGLAVAKCPFQALQRRTGRARFPFRKQK